MRKFMHRFLCAENGTTAIEYSLIAALVVITIVGAIQMLGKSIVDVLYNKLAVAFG